MNVVDQTQTNSIRKVESVLKLKYKNAIADAVADLVPAEEIKNTFSGFQK